MSASVVAAITKRLQAACASTDSAYFLPNFDLTFGDLSSSAMVELGARTRSSADELAEQFVAEAREIPGAAHVLSASRGRLNLKLQSLSQLFSEGRDSSVPLPPTASVLEVVCESGSGLSAVRHEALADCHLILGQYLGWNVEKIAVSPSDVPNFREGLQPKFSRIYFWGPPHVITGDWVSECRRVAESEGAAVMALGYTSSWSGAREKAKGPAILPTERPDPWYIASPLPAEELDLKWGWQDGRYPLGAYAAQQLARVQNLSLRPRNGTPHACAWLEAPVEKLCMHRAVFLPELLKRAALTGEVRDLIGAIHQFATAVDRLLAEADPLEKLQQITGEPDGRIPLSCIHASLEAVIGLMNMQS